MTLRPLTRRAEPSYPARPPLSRRLGARARRLGLAVTASLVIPLGAGCYGAMPYQTGDSDAGGGTNVVEDAGADADSVAPDAAPDGEVPDVEVETPDGDVEVRADADLSPPPQECMPYRLSGDAQPPTLTFACGETLPADAPVFEAPQYLMHGDFCPDASAWAWMEVREPFLGEVGLNGEVPATLRLTSPDGGTVLELGAERLCTVTEVEAGRWLVEVAPTDPSASWFEMFFDEHYEL